MVPLKDLQLKIILFQEVLFRAEILKFIFA